MRIELVQNKEEILKAGRVTGTGLVIATQEKKVIDSFNDMTDEKAKKLRGKVWGTPHTSVYEFMDFTILLEDVSLLVEFFLIQYRLASFTIKSRRYVDFTNQGFYIPDLKFKTAKSTEREREVKEYIRKEISDRFEDYNRLVASGVEKEDARYILPACIHSSIEFKMNAIEIYKMLSDGISFSNIPEIEEMCSKIQKMLAEHLPEMYDTIKPNNNTMEINSAIDKISDLNDFEPLIIKPSPYNINVTNVAFYDQLDSFFTNVNLASIITGYQMHENRSTVKDLMVSLVKNNHKVNELLSIGAFNHSHYIITMSLAAFTHIARHRMQTLITPPIHMWGRFETFNTMDNRSEFKTTLDKHRIFIDTLKEEGLDDNLLSYFMLCGDMIQGIHKANIRELKHISHLRQCTRAQDEIRKLVTDEIYILMNNLDKSSEYKDIIESIFGPTCKTYGKCKEGRMACSYGKSLK